MSISVLLRAALIASLPSHETERDATVIKSDTRLQSQVNDPQGRLA